MTGKGSHNKGSTNLHDAIAEELLGTEETMATSLLDSDPDEIEPAELPEGDMDMGAETRVVSFTPEMQRALEAGVTMGVDKLQPIPEDLQAKLDFGDKQVALTKPLTIIGRVPEVSDIPLPQDDQVSRHHAAVTFSKGAFFIEDLESTNGTFVDGKRIKRTKLERDVVVRVGLTTFTLVTRQP